jgi:hypothetical protein
MAGDAGCGRRECDGLDSPWPTLPAGHFDYRGDLIVRFLDRWSPWPGRWETTARFGGLAFLTASCPKRRHTHLQESAVRQLGSPKAGIANHEESREER